MKFYKCEVGDEFETGGRNRFRAVDTKKMVEIIKVEVAGFEMWIDKEEYGDYRGKDTKQGV